MNLEDAVKLSRDLRTFGKTIKGSIKTIEDTTHTIDHIKRLAGRSKSGDVSSKLITAGMACLLFPEPVFSDIIGSMLIATGMVVRNRKGPTIMDVFKETRKMMTDLRKINMEL